MATLYEKYITGDDTVTHLYPPYWRAQTFTPATAHKITSVKLLLYRTNSPGTLTVSIQGVDGSNHPDMADTKCSGTTDGDTLTADTAGEWREITLGAGYDLDADTQYAIVARALGGDSSNRVTWRYDGSDPTYAGGCWEYSNDSGETWASVATADFMFEDWGEPLGETHYGVATLAGTGSLSAIGSFFLTASATLSGVGSLTAKAKSIFIEPTVSNTGVRANYEKRRRLITLWGQQGIDAEREYFK